MNLVVSEILLLPCGLRCVLPRLLYETTCSLLLCCFEPFTDYAWDFAAPKDPEVMKKKVNSELLNGRLAMCAIGGIATQSVITGHGFPYI